MKTKKFILGLFAIVVLIGLISLEKTHLDHSKSVTTIPKIIWTFWDSKDIPNVVKGCIQSWKTSNPDYTVNILNLDNYQGYLQFKPNFSMKNVIPAHQADWIRIAVLAEHGPN
jgi:mannosyltransferase OCH1-like enzyme